MISVNEIQPIEESNRFFSLFAPAIIIVPNNILSATAAQVSIVRRAASVRLLAGAIDDASTKTLLGKIMHSQHCWKIMAGVRRKTKVLVVSNIVCRGEAAGRTRARSWGRPPPSNVGTWDMRSNYSARFERP
jgi:hypothetical protein